MVCLFVAAILPYSAILYLRMNFPQMNLPSMPPFKPALPLVELPAEHYTDLLTGTVKCWFEDRGFGFITPEGGEEDVFVHKKVLKDGQSLIVGSSVMFNLIYDADRRRFQATRCFGATIPPETQAHADSNRKWPFCLADPWEELYRSAGADHLRVHLGGVQELQEPRVESTSGESAPKETKQTTKAEETEAKPAKPTSIYEFFEDDSMIL